MFYIGQKVICIDDQPGVHDKILPGTQLPKRDKIYVIREIYTTRQSTIALLLREVINLPHPVFNRELGFRSSRFRPIDSSVRFVEETLKRVGEAIETIEKRKVNNRV